MRLLRKPLREHITDARYGFHLSRFKGYFPVGNRGFFAEWHPENEPPRPAEGYKLHVAIKDPMHAALVARDIGALLREARVAHKFVSTRRGIEQQSTSYQAGKALTIYPRDNAHLLQVAKAVDDRLVQMGLTDNNPIGKPLDSRGIGKSGLMFYRYAPLKSLSYAPRLGGRFDVAQHKFVSTDQESPDLRMPFEYQPFSGKDGVAEAAARLKLPVEGMQNFAWRANAHVDHLITEAQSRDDARALDALKTRKDYLAALLDNFRDSEAVTVDPKNFDRSTLISAAFKDVYRRVHEGGPITSTVGIQDPEFIISHIREKIERPVMDGRAPDPDDLGRLTNSGYAPRKLVRATLLSLGLDKNGKPL